ncbi:MAG: polyprenyl synthetase family protein, partial [Anaerolineae bacterium]
VSHPTLDDADVAEAQALLEAAGSRKYTEERAAAYHRRAMEAFERTKSQGEAAEALKGLAQKLLNRDK